MTSQVNHNPSVSSENPDDVPDVAVRQLIGAITQIADSSSYQKLAKLCDDHKKTTQDLQERKIANEKNLEDLVESKKKVKTLEGTIKDLHDTNRALEERNSNKEDNLRELTQQQHMVNQELTNAYNKEKALNKEISRLKAEAEVLQGFEKKAQEKEASEQKLQRQKANLEKQLERLESFSPELDDLDSVGVKISRSLADLFKEACSIAREFFFQELDEESFAPSLWAEVAQRVKTKPYLPELPLPRSNSLAAKKMRFVVGLMMLGDALSTHVLQPVYITKEDNGLSEVLEKLSEDDPEHEAHARAVILHLSNSMQEDHGQARASRAAEETMENISGIVPLNKRADLEKQLHSYCHKAMLWWLPVQRLKQHVTVDVGAEEGERWKILPLPASDLASAQPQKGNAATKSNSGGNGNGKNSATPAQKPRATANQSVLLGAKDRYYEIWPAFKSSDEEYLCEGYILTSELPNEAWKEEEKARQAEEELRRTERKLSRKGTGDASNGGAQARVSRTGSFLSSGNGKTSAGG